MGFSVPLTPALFCQRAQGLGRELEHREEGGPGEGRDDPAYPGSIQVEKSSSFFYRVCGFESCRGKFLPGGFSAPSLLAEPPG